MSVFLCVCVCECVSVCVCVWSLNRRWPLAHCFTSRTPDSSPGHSAEVSSPHCNEGMLSVRLLYPR